MDPSTARLTQLFSATLAPSPQRHGCVPSILPGIDRGSRRSAARAGNKDPVGHTRHPHAAQYSLLSPLLLHAAAFMPSRSVVRVIENRCGATARFQLSNKG